MPKNDHIGRKPEPRPTKLLEVDATPESLGRFLRDKYDLVIMGERHSFPEIQKTEWQVSQHLDLKNTFVEASPSKRDLYNDRSRKVTSSWNPDEPDSFRDSVINREGVFHPVDIEAIKSPISIHLLTKIEGKAEGVAGELARAFQFAVEQIKPSTSYEEKIWNDLVSSKDSDDDLRKSVNQLLNRHRDVITEHVAHNLRQTTERYIFEHRDDLSASVQRFGRKIFPERPKLDLEWLHERDRAMADGIDTALKVPQNGPRQVAAPFPVGSRHNKGVEELLEQRGYRVANLKIEPTPNLSLDRKVYWNPSPSSREDAEWVITVHSSNAPPLESYSMPGNQRCQKPTEISKAKLLLHDLGSNSANR